MHPLSTYQPPDFSAAPLAQTPAAQLIPAPADGIAPAGFHATSNFPEYVKLDGYGWVLAPESRMDAVLVVDQGALRVVEARNLAMSLDFSLFPAIEDFSREGSSNISIFEIREKGLFSKAKIGHLSGGSGDGITAIAVIAIVAAIAIPNLMRARKAGAN